MSNCLPTPPPPPTSSSLFMKCENNKTNVKSIINKRPLFNECLWAVEYPELQKACFLAQICTKKPPVKCKYYNIKSILQVGPTCGLTAISMLLGGIPPAEQLLQEAQQKHFTYNGEMFSAHYLFQLTCDNLNIINNNNNNIVYVNNNNNFSQPNTKIANDKETEKTQESTIAKHNNVIECQLHEGRLNCAKVIESLQHGACIFVPYPFLKENKHLSDF